MHCSNTRLSNQPWLYFHSFKNDKSLHPNQPFKKGPLEKLSWRLLHRDELAELTALLHVRYLIFCPSQVLQKTEKGTRGWTLGLNDKTNHSEHQSSSPLGSEFKLFLLLPVQKSRPCNDNVAAAKQWGRFSCSGSESHHAVHMCSTWYLELDHNGLVKPVLRVGASNKLLRS